MGSIQKIKRESSPKHFSLRIDSFSILAKASTIYESVVFSAEGHSWKLQFYPNGNAKENGKNHISLYLAIDGFSSNADVNVEVKFFVFDQIRDNYLTIFDGTVKRFHKMKTIWGYAQLLTLNDFKDPHNGYLANDSCEIGVELCVVSSKAQKRQTLSHVKPPSTYVPFRMTFKNFSAMGKDLQYGDTIKFADKEWKLRLYPNGTGNEAENSLSLFLELIDGAKLLPGEEVWADFKLRVIDQRQDKHVEKSYKDWFGSKHIVWGSRNFMPLGDLYQARKGFVMNDNLIVEVEFINVCTPMVS